MIEFIIVYNLSFLCFYCLVGMFNRDFVDNLFIEIILGPRLINKIFFVLLSPFLILKFLIFILFEEDIFTLIEYLLSDDDEDDEDEDKDRKDK